MCVSSATVTPSLYTFQPFATDFSGTGTYGATTSFTTLSICPAMTAVATPITAATALNQVGLWIKPVAGDGAAYGTVTFEIDSITVTPDNLEGPYDFATTTQGLTANTGFNFVTGTTVTWQATP
jgi:hypothetical protein